MIRHNATVRPDGHAFGWRGTEPKSTLDRLYVPNKDVIASLPASTNNRSRHPTWLLPQATQDQKNEGSCTAWAAKKLCFWAYRQAGWHGAFEPSARALYYTERQVLEGPQYNIRNATQQDTGGYGRAVIQASVTYGITAESNCPYTPADGNPLEYLAVAPDPATYVNMHKHLDTSNQSIVQDRTHMQAALAAGHPFILGFTVYASFESPSAQATGNVPMPLPGEQVLGGHEFFIVDYVTDNGGLFYVGLGSWGLYGHLGEMYFPAAYLEDPDLADDLWTILKQY